MVLDDGRALMRKVDESCIGGGDGKGEGVGEGQGQKYGGAEDKDC